MLCNQCIIYYDVEPDYIFCLLSLNTIFFRKVLYSFTKDKVLGPVLKKPHSSNYIKPKK